MKNSAQPRTGAMITKDGESRTQNTSWTLLRRRPRAPTSMRPSLTPCRMARGAHNKIADFFFCAPGRPTLIVALAKAFYELAAEVA